MLSTWKKWILWRWWVLSHSRSPLIAFSMAWVQRHLQTPTFPAQPLLTLVVPSWNWLPHLKTGSSLVPRSFLTPASIPTCSQNTSTWSHKEVDHVPFPSKPRCNRIGIQVNVFLMLGFLLLPLVTFLSCVVLLWPQHRVFLFVSLPFWRGGVCGKWGDNR